MPAQRADARRNHARLLAVAEEEIAAHGADASLEQIARVAGVGSATVRRHFPNRRALLDAVFRGRIEALCAHARDLGSTADARTALLEWLRAVTEYGASTRGLAVALLRDMGASADAEHGNTCANELAAAGEPLVERAAEAGAVAPGVTAEDLVTLVTGITLATEHHPDPVAEADRMLGLTMVGVLPQG